MKKKYVIAVATAFLMCAIIIVISLSSLPNAYLSPAAIEKAKSVLPDVTLKAVNANISDELVFVTEGMDAQLYIEGINKSIGALIFDLAEPLPENTKYQLFYSRNESGLSEDNSISGFATGNSDILSIELPLFSKYDLFRLDIDTEYQIEDISAVNDKEMYFHSGSYLTGVLEKRLKIPYMQVLLCLCILLVEALLIAWKWKAIGQWWQRTKGSVVANRAGLLRGSIICLIGLAAGILAWACLYKAGMTHSKSFFTIFCFADAGLCVGLLIAMYRQLARNPERGFVVIALCIGLLFAVVEPPVVGLSWDDQAHYGRAVCLNYGGLSYISRPEKKVANLAVTNDVNLSYKLEIANKLDAMPFRSRGSYSNRYTIPYYTFVSYLPSSGMMWLARILGFSFSNTVIMGRLGNLLCYVLVVYFAIKQLKYGKLFLSSLCLLPTILFMAGNYSYDPFCIAFILLGICIWMGVYQRPESKMTAVKTTVTLLALTMGILPKTVYFPLVLFVLFLPGNRFESKAAAKRYRIAVLLTAFLLVICIVAPFITSNSGEMFTDVRGGTDVDAKQQIIFILNNPVQYAAILLRFLFMDYFSYDSIMAATVGCVRAFAYVSIQGVIFSEKIACVFLGIAFIAWLLSFDIVKTRREKVPVWVKLVCCILSFGTICIAATSLYCGFTPVGHESINGFQARYMLPVILSMLTVLRPSVQLSKKQLTIEWAKAAVVYAEAVVLLIGMWPFVQQFL